MDLPDDDRRAVRRRRKRPRGKARPEPETDAHPGEPDPRRADKELADEVHGHARRGQGAFADQLPLELSQRREDAEHEAPCGGGGVDLRALPGEHPQAHVAGRQVLHGVDQVDEVATEAVELPDDEHVARPERAHAAVESRPVVADARREVVVDVDGVDARGPQRVALQVQRLGAVCFRDAGVANQHVS